MSVIHKGKIPDGIELQKSSTVIKGVGGQIHTGSIAYLTLQSHDGALFNHKFHVLDQMPCDSDGLIGLDFLRAYDANINLPLNELSLNNNGTEYTIPINTTQSNESEIYLELPARSESIHFIQLKCTLDFGKEYVVFAKKLDENIFLAGSIVTPENGKIPIQILNTNEKNVKIPIFEPEIDLLQNYETCNFMKSEKTVDRVIKVLESLNFSHLNSEEKKSIQNICAKYSDIFYIEGDKLGTTNILQQSITVKPNTQPIYTKPYRLAESLKPEIRKQIQKLIEDDIIEPTNSEWNSPILLVPKKSDDSNRKRWRLVIDYRKINQVIENDKFPLPNITEILDSLTGAIYFTHLDLQQSYYQTVLDEPSRKVTAFTTNSGQFQMKRLPMGLKISPSAFSRVMSIALSGLTYEKCFVYMDDIIIFGRSLESHNKNLIDIFERLRKVNLKINPSKCDFLKKELLYLGHIISAEGVLPDPEKIKIIQNYPKPKNTDEVHRFVAFCNYYRKFVPSFAEITLPLNKLCRKNATFIWTEECEKSFEILKQALASPPILQYPDFSENNEFVLQTDASGTAIGSVLCNKDLRPVAYASRPLNKAELNYPVIQKELLAIVWSVKYFRPYLFGKSFTIMTDHKPLIYLFGMKDPSNRLVKFRIELEEYDYKIVYIKGKDNAVADALSRVTITSDELKNLNNKIMTMVMTRAQRKKIDEENKLQSNNNTCSATSSPSMSKDRRSDQPKIAEILRKPSDSAEIKFIPGNELKKLRVQNKITKEKECFAYIESQLILYINLNYMSHFTRAVFANMLRKFCKEINIEELSIIKNKENALFIKELCEEIKNNVEWTGPRINVLRNVRRINNKDEKTIILNDYHLLPTSGHAGVRRMVNSIKSKYYWPSLDNDVRNYVKNCKKCQTMKYSRTTKEPMVVTTTATSAFEKVFIDIVGPLDTDSDGYTYILTVQCELSKYVEAYPLHRKDTVSVARALVNNFILRYGIPKIIASDRGTEFISSTMEEVCKLLQIEKIHSTAYHHESIGALENTHKHLAAFLRIQCDEHPETWSQWLQFWCFSFNTVIHSETKYSPYELVFGKPCNLPSNLKNCIEPLYNPYDYALELKYRLQVAQNDARKNLIESKIKRKCNYDKNMNPVTYKKDDLILLKNETAKKLEKLFKGPFKVVEDLGANVKIIKENNKTDIVHKNRTKLFIQ